MELGATEIPFWGKRFGAEASRFILFCSRGLTRWGIGNCLDLPKKYIGCYHGYLASLDEDLGFRVLQFYLDLR